MMTEQLDSIPKEKKPHQKLEPSNTKELVYKMMLEQPDSILKEEMDWNSWTGT